MNAKRFSDAMSEIDNKYVDEALSYSASVRHPRRFRRVSVVLAAAILAIFLMGAAVVASVFGTQIIEFFTSHTESGFDLGIKVKKIPINEFSEDIHEAGEVIEQQFKDYKVYDSWYPGEWQTTFSTRDQACEYVGFDKLKQIDWDFDEQITTLSIMGNEQGKILSLNLETPYVINDMNVQFFTQIYTENYNEELVLETRFPESAEFEESYYTTNSNKQCHIISSSVLESGYMCLEGYIVDEGILYSLNIAYQENDSTQAMELMHQWANLF